MAPPFRLISMVAAAATTIAAFGALPDGALDAMESSNRSAFSVGTAAPPVALAAPRLVDGNPVPPFGASLDGTSGDFTWSEGFFIGNLAQWPQHSGEPGAVMPLAYGQWTGGPYKNPSGQRWVDQINAWYREGTAAGLTQDAFRSFDNGHSGLRKDAYPQLRVEKAVANFGNPAENIFRPRVTMGVQSYGMGGRSVIEESSRGMLRQFATVGGKPPPFQRFYRLFYENNFLFVAPAVGSYSKENDTFAFLSPFYLHSIGASGTDAKLLKPIVYASAALPPALKTRMLRQGQLVPSLLYLFKNNIAADITSPDAHVPAYTLPAEAADDFDGPTPFLDGLLNDAHNLTHIPPVCRLRVTKFSVEVEGEPRYGNTAYHEENQYAVSGALRPGQSFVIEADLRYSWTDDNLPVDHYYAKILRGDAAIESLNEEGSVLRITIAWAPTNNRNDLRADLLFLVHDGAYYSAPAYISVRHIHKLDPITLGIKAQ